MTPQEFLQSEKKILTYPNDSLTQRCEVITNISEWRDVVREMYYIMNKNNGAGLAANQVGLPYRLFIIATTHDDSPVFNPDIVWHSAGTNVDVEGCLSIPGEQYEVRRWNIVKLSYYDLEGKYKVVMLKDFDARVVQHEIDHLNGILINKRGKKI